MATDMKRLMVSLSPELVPELDKLKKEQFYDASQAEMIRFLIRRGLETVEETEKAVSKTADNP